MVQVWFTMIRQYSLYRNSQGAAKNRERSNWLQLPAMIIGRGYRPATGTDINGDNRMRTHHRLQQSLFSPVLIEFSAVITPIFCPNG